MDPTPAELRHAIRGTLNALKLCVSAFEMPLDTSEKLEFLSDIETAAEKLSSLVAQFGELPDAIPQPAQPGAVAAHVR
jgi:hypothetical protein